MALLWHLRVADKVHYMGVILELAYVRPGQVILISAHKFIELHAFGHSILLSLQLVA